MRGLILLTLAMVMRRSQMLSRRSRSLRRGRAAEESLSSAITSKEKDEQSHVIFDVKPFGSETNVETMITSVQSIQIDGLTWGQA